MTSCWPWAAAVNLLLVPVAVIFKPGGGSSLVKVSWSFGAFAGLIAAIAAFAPLARAALRAQPGPGAQRLNPGFRPVTPG